MKNPDLFFHLDNDEEQTKMKKLKQEGPDHGRDAFRQGERAEAVELEMRGK